MQVYFDVKSQESYRTFLRAKTIPQCRFIGHTAEIPDEYAHLLGVTPAKPIDADYKPLPTLFDYQRDISRLAIRKRKFAAFVDPGLGKTLILLEFARHASGIGNRTLIVSPLMVVRQTIAESKRFYGESLPIEQVRAASLNDWINGTGPSIGITNYDAIRDNTPQGNLGALILDELSMLKSAYGKWGQRLIEMGHGLQWKLCCTGTPAPNDRIEYGNHAVFLDQFNTLNAFLARYFVNRGQTDNRWELKPHALRPFYKDLSHWAIFMTNPATYGWKDNSDTIPPIHVHIHDVPLTDQQGERVAHAGGDMFGTPGGITSRAKLSQLAKGRHNGEAVETHKPKFIRDLVNSFKGESTIIWCVYNAEQDSMEAMFPGAVAMRGDTPEDEREEIIQRFKSGAARVLISKPKLLGFGLNLQIATRQVFSGLVDSYESYYQAVKRSNRVGSTVPLNVHLPVTTIERAMIDTVLRKTHRVQHDAEEQEALFKECGHVFLG